MSAVKETIHKANYEYPYVDIGKHFEEAVLHFHEETEILYVEDGSIVVTLNSENRLLTRGDICVVLPGQIHTLTQTGPVKIYVMKLYPVLDLRNIQLEKYVFQEQDLCYPVLLKQVRKIIEEDRMRAPGYEVAVAIACGGIMLYILRELPQKEIGPAGVKKMRHYAEFINEVNAYLEEHYETAVSLEEIAAHFNYSREYYSIPHHKHTYSV